MTDQMDPQSAVRTNGHRDTAAPLLSLTSIKKHFPVSNGLLSRLAGDTKHVKAVDGVDLDVKRGETVGIVGESGSGKSTLARTVARLHEPTEGTVEFDGEYLGTYSGSELKPFRRRIQYVFQDPLSALNPRQTVGESVRKPLDVHDIGEPATRWERVESLFRKVGLTPGQMDAYPHELSGGQLQRVGLCRALILEPDLLIFDEPVSALDVTLQAQILNLIQRLQSELDLTYIIISHNLDVVRHVCDRIAVMYAGEFVEKGPASDVFQDPRHPYTRALVAAIPSMDNDTTDSRNLLDGTPPSATDPPSGCRFHTRCPEFIDGRCIKSTPDLQTVDGEADREVACHWNDRSEAERRSHTTPSDSEREVIEREVGDG